jgi:hypothetical protein
VEPLFYFSVLKTGVRQGPNCGWDALGSLFLAVEGVWCCRMNWGQLSNGVKQIWDNNPGVIVLIILGFVVFLVIVLDARHHRQKHKGKHPKKY